MNHCYSRSCLRGSSAADRTTALHDPSTFNESGCECECEPCHELPQEGERDVYMVHVNWSGAVFVKALDFFRSQGGFRDAWGLHWSPLVATGIEDAREKGCKLPGAKPYDWQAKP